VEQDTKIGLSLLWFFGGFEMSFPNKTIGCFWGRCPLPGCFNPSVCAQRCYV